MSLGDLRPPPLVPSAAGPFANGGRGAGAAPGANPFAAGSATSGNTTRTRTRPRSAPPPMAPDATQEDNQRQKSMDLVNEGLTVRPDGGMWL